MPRTKPVKQIYSQYTEADFHVWATLFERQMAFLPGRVTPAFLEAVQAIGFSADHIPHIDSVNQHLLDATGWKLVVVPELTPIERFLQHLARKEFTVTCWLRSPHELDYLEEPDMFHDVFGHAPLLTNADYADFFHELGALGLRHLDKPEIVRMLYRLYWFTVEFGLVREEEGLRIYGAGIVSSPGETLHALSDQVQQHPFEVKRVAAHPFRTDVMQDEYYVIEGFDSLRHSVPQLEDTLLSQYQAGVA
jgi:phenylalanine-4-hydroxylase